MGFEFLFFATKTLNHGRSQKNLVKFCVFVILLLNHIFKDKSKSYYYSRQQEVRQRMK